MIRTKTMVLICPTGHVFATFDRIDQTFTCPECNNCFTQSPVYETRTKEIVRKKSNGAPRKNQGFKFSRALVTTPAEPPCSEYLRFLEEYNRGIDGLANARDGCVQSAAQVLESKYQQVLTHLQSCPSCQKRLGYTDSGHSKVVNS